MNTRATFRRGHRYFRFGMRGLVLAVLLMGSWLGWLARNVRVERQTVAAIEQAGGLVSYDLAPTDKTGNSSNPKPGAQRWLANAIGADYFANPRGVTFKDKGTDKELALVGRLSTVVTVTFADADITDTGLAHLEGMRNLRELRISGSSRITDAGLATLEGMTGLSTLSLFGTQVTDEGLSHLNGLTNLVTLELSLTQITDSGWDHLEGLTNLRELDLSGTATGDAGLAHVSALGNLAKLSVFGTKVTDSGLSHLGRLMSLSELDLRLTKVTDAGLTHLNNLTKLSKLDLRFTNVTSDGTQDLERALPRLNIVR